MAGDQANFSDKTTSVQQDLNQGTETTFHEENGLAATRTHEKQDVLHGLQMSSPDKPVVSVNDLSGNDLKTFQNAFVEAHEQCFKVSDPIRSVKNNIERQLQHGTPEEAASSSKWGESYCRKVEEVVADNIEAASANMDKRVAIGRQSFMPNANGKMQAETLYAIFPPPPGETRIVDRYVAFPLHSNDPAREAELRRMTPSLANHITADEWKFALAASGAIPRRSKSTT